MFISNVPEGRRKAAWLRRNIDVGETSAFGAAKPTDDVTHTNRTA